MANSYPLPSYHFEVSITDDETKSMAFSEVSGLTMESNVIEYREGQDNSYRIYKMPGSPKFSKITLKRGTTAANNLFADWFSGNKLNTAKRHDVTISLLNEEHEAVITWSVANAFPVKVDFGSLNASENKVLIETLELEHEGLKIVERKKD